MIVTFPEFVHVEVPAQHCMLMPGKYHMPIGQAYELVQAGKAKAQPQSAKEMDAFAASVQAANVKAAEAQRADKAELAKAQAARKKPSNK